MLMPSTPRLCALTACRTEVHLCSTLIPLSWNIDRFGATDPLHAALHDGVLNPEGFGELRRDRHVNPYLPRGHPDRAVEADHLAVEHRVLDDVHCQRAVLLGAAEAGRVGHLLAQRLLRLHG